MENNLFEVVLLHSLRVHLNPDIAVLILSFVDFGTWSTAQFLVNQTDYDRKRSFFIKFFYGYLYNDEYRRIFCVNPNIKLFHRNDKFYQPIHDVVLRTVIPWHHVKTLSVMGRFSTIDRLFISLLPGKKSYNLQTLDVENTLFDKNCLETIQTKLKNRTAKVGSLYKFGWTEHIKVLNISNTKLNLDDFISLLAQPNFWFPNLQTVFFKCIEDLPTLLIASTEEQMETLAKAIAHHPTLKKVETDHALYHKLKKHVPRKCPVLITSQ